MKHLFHKYIKTPIQRKLRRFLGLGETFIGVDYGIKGQSCVVVVSRLNNGSVRIIDCRFDNGGDMERMVEELQYRYGVRQSDTIIDGPLHYKSDLAGGLRRW